MRAICYSHPEQAGCDALRSVLCRAKRVRYRTAEIIHHSPAQQVAVKIVSV